MNSARYDDLLLKYKMGWITDKTLLGWVTLNKKHPGSGITESEFKEITGREYND